MDFSNAMCNDGIMLEPRLMEYMNKKKMYRDNDIDSVVSLEKIYSISRDDKKRISGYMKGKRNLYTSRTLNTDSHFIDPSKNKFVTLEAESSQMDPHFAKLQQKMQRHKDANISRRNFSGMANVYQDTPYNFTDETMYGRPAATRNTSYSTPSNYYNTLPRTKQRDTDKQADDNYLLDSRDTELFDNPHYMHHPKRRSNMTYHHEPKISMNNRLFTRDLGYRQPDREHTQAVDKIIGTFDSYANQQGNSLYRCAEIDMNGKRFIPDTTSSNKREHKTTYQAVPYMSSTNGMVNMDMGNSLQYGVNSRAGKGFGYKNPTEHYYDYIDRDIQQPDHVVHDRGYPSRSENKTRATPYTRDIL
jgi:hypothetical protein